MTFSKKWAVGLLVFMLMTSVTEAFAAKRLGQGSSIGQRRDSGSLQRAPAAAPTPPAAPANAGIRPTMPQAPVAPAPVPQRNSWWGPLAGFAGGALLGSLFFGHGGFGGGAGLLGLLLWGALGVFFVLLIRRFLAGANPSLMTIPTPGVNGAPQVAPIEPSVVAPTRPPLQLPLGFDLDAFLHQAKVAYIRLQAANDAGDLNDLRAFTTPEMYAEISLAIQARHGASQRVDVLRLDAELLDITLQGEVALATVQYFVTAREDNGPEESFTELWHVRKLLSDPNAPWLLAGIEQVS